MPQTHPPWFDPHINYSGDQWKFAIALGRGVGFASADDWMKAETALQELWEALSDQRWTSARSAIYAGWYATRRAEIESGSAQREIEMEKAGSLVLARVEAYDPSRDAWFTVAYLVRGTGNWKRAFEIGSKPNVAFAAAREFLREMAASNA